MVFVIAGLMLLAVVFSYLVYAAPYEPWCCHEHGQPGCSMCNGEDMYTIDTIPIGMIIEAQPIDDIPGWLIPDGRLLRRSDYPELFSAIGLEYDRCVIDPELFRIPKIDNATMKVSHGRGK